jgi:hypothetical protein
MLIVRRATLRTRSNERATEIAIMAPQNVLTSVLCQRDATCRAFGKRPTSLAPYARRKAAPVEEQNGLVPSVETTVEGSVKRTGE